MKRNVLAFLLILSAAIPAFAGEADVYKYAQTSSTATVSATAALLHTVSVTSGVAAFTIYDSTAVNQTSAPIAVFSSTATGTFIFDAQTQNGIQLNGQASGSQVTVTYRN